jgi:hypothetical protein
MQTHRFGRKLKLPSTFAIKHQIRRLMLEDLLEEVELAASAEIINRQMPEKIPPDEQIQP